MIAIPAPYTREPSFCDMIELITFGGASVFRDGEEVVGLLAQRQKVALLVYLALEGPVTRDHLLNLFWSDRDPERGRHALSQAIYVLKKELGDECLNASVNQVELVDGAVQTDARRLEKAAGAEDWATVVELYIGPFLKQFHLNGTPAFADWQMRTRSRLGRLARQAFDHVVEARTASGDIDGALGVAARRAAVEPLEDEAQHSLITLLARAGYRTAALELYEAYRERLARELEVDPLEETVALVERIRAGDFLDGGPPASEEATPRVGADRRGRVAGAEGQTGSDTSPAEADSVAEGFTSLMRELGDRRVLLIGLAYLAVTWVAFRVAANLSELGLLPVGFGFLLLFLLGVGFPVAIRAMWRRGSRLSAEQRRKLSIDPRAAARWIPRFSPGRLLAGLGTAFVALLAADLFLERALDASPRLDVNRIVSFPLVAGGDGDRAYVGEDVATWIGWALENTAPLQWLDGWELLDERHREDARLLTAQAAGGLAQERRAGFYLTGRIVWQGDSAAVFLKLYDVLGDSTLADEGVYGHADEVVQSGLTAVSRLLPALIAPGMAVDLSALTDRHPQAVANFLLGERAYRRARFVEALSYYRSAIAADSAFAVAALKGAQAASWNRQFEEAEALVGLALNRLSELPLRHARFTRGMSDYFTGRADSAVARFREALDADPEWRDAWMALGEVFTHLLPREAPLDSLAEAAFARARQLDEGFAPPLFHLIEFAARSGETERGRSLLAELQAASSDTAELVLTTRLILDCVEGTPASINWDREVERAPGVVYQAAASLAVAGWQAECAEASWAALLEFDTATDASFWNRRFNAAMGLQSLLVARRRYNEAAAVLDSGVPWAHAKAHVYLFDGAAGAELPEAREAADLLWDYHRSGYAPEYPQGPYLWFLGSWEIRFGSPEQAGLLADSLRSLAARSGSRTDSLLARSLRARVTLARGDTIQARALLSAIVPSKRRNDPWYPWESLANERLALAELLLARGEYDAAHAVASDLDAPARPVTDLVYLPASLTLRAMAAERLGREALARRYRARLAQLEGG